MRKYLLPEAGSFYKANLHCHSTYSDGNLSVDEIKKLYKDAGYSVVAFTDHNVLIDNSRLNDENFLTLTAIEVDVKDLNDNRKPCFHLNFYAKDPHNTAVPLFNPEQMRHQGRSDIDYPEQKYLGTPDYVRDYFKINEIVSEYVKNGFIGCLNHVTWSIQDLDDYRDIEGIFAMEIYNHSCFLSGFYEVNSAAYDDLLRRGKRICCIAADDSHNKFPADHPRFDSLGGFVMLKSPSLAYGDIMSALESGKFYSSTGPEIYEMYTEDGKLYIKTSPAAKIAVTGFGRTASVAYPEKRGGTITEAELSLNDPRYFRVTVYGENGGLAWSNAYFAD